MRLAAQLAKAVKKLSTIFGIVATWVLLSGAGVFLGVPADGCGGFAISSVSGTIDDGETITISGCDFGGAPPISNFFFENFDDGGTLGNEIGLTATIGSWADFDVSNGGPEYDAIAFSGNRGGEIFGPGSSFGDYQRGSADLTTPATECYVTYQWQIPDGSTFPGETDEELTSGGSSLKLFWLFGDDGVQDDDITFFSCAAGVGNPCAGQFFGNDLDWGFTDYFDFFDWDVWNRFSVYAKAGADPDVDVGLWYWENINASGYKRTIDTTQIIFNHDHVNHTAPEQWEQFTMIGAWNQNSGESSVNAKIVVDDLFVSCGDNARARVEICDASTRATSGQCMIAPVATWANTSITLELHAAPFTVIADPAYLIVVDADGNESTAHQLDAP